MQHLAKDARCSGLARDDEEQKGGERKPLAQARSGSACAVMSRTGSKLVSMLPVKFVRPFFLLDKVCNHPV
eukprot:5199365-Amphidinium_carterae.1